MSHNKECLARSCKKYSECGPEFVCTIRIEGFPALDTFKPDFYEHIDSDGPIFIESRKQLKEECASRGLEARCLKDGYGRNYKDTAGIIGK